MVLLLVSNAARIFGFHINNFQFTVFFTVLTIPVYTYIRRKTCKFIEGMCLSPSLLYCIVLLVLLLELWCHNRPSDMHVSIVDSTCKYCSFQQLQGPCCKKQTSVGSEPRTVRSSGHPPYQLSCKVDCACPFR